ncbi:hypothetical protein C5167_005291 [Papaver somniferum]|uniref:Uncharacterized protein n=1 Tax=Papaver somniferum TaxID=3469 RepID=A0A4Y7JBW2_PAPSO|nr:hypothetical protein C5167_005291 [Papaver somniferum]
MYLFGRQVSYLQVFQTFNPCAHQVDPTSNHFCGICISSQCKYTDLQHKDFGFWIGKRCCYCHFLYSCIELPR